MKGTVERKREREKEEVAMQRLGVFSLPSSFVFGAFVRPLPLPLSVPLDGPPDAAEDSTPEVKEGLIMIVRRIMASNFQRGERKQRPTSRFNLSKWFHVIEGKLDNNEPDNW